MFFIKNLLVFFGGKSPERDISVITGLLTLNSLDKNFYNAIPIYVDGKGVFYTGEALKNISFYKNFDYSKAKKVTFSLGEKSFYIKKRRKNISYEVYCAINCMHGRGGEDGVFSALMRLLNVAFVSPDIFASALSIDKHFTKIALNSLKIKNAPYFKIKREQFFLKSDLICRYLANSIGFPLVVKPARLGSSIGIVKVEEQNQLFGALCQAFNYDDKVICERFLNGAIDINCAVYSCKNKIYVSKLEQALHSGDILSFADKYSGGEKTVGSERISAHFLPEKVKDEIVEISKKIYRSFDFSSVVRFDYLVLGEEVFLNEINAVPGSLAYYLFCESTLQFTKLLNDLIEDAIEKKRSEDNLISVYKSQVLFGDYKNLKK